VNWRTKLTEKSCRISTVVYALYLSWILGSQGRVKFMKSVVEGISTKHSTLTTPDNQAHGRSSRIHYILVAVLLGLVFLISSGFPTAPDTVSFSIGSGFLFFWLGGGLITLALLTKAAKH